LFFLQLQITNLYIRITWSNKVFLKSFWWSSREWYFRNLYKQLPRSDWSGSDPGSYPVPDLYIDW